MTYIQTTELERQMWRETVERRKRLGIIRDRNVSEDRLRGWKEKPKLPEIIEQPKPEPSKPERRQILSKEAMTAGLATAVLIRRIVADVFDVADRDILGGPRSSNSRMSRLYNARLAWARHVSMYFCRRFLPLPTARIAVFHGRSDHTVVLNSVEKVNAEIEVGSLIAGWINVVCQRIESDVEIQARIQPQDEAPRMGTSAGHLPEVWAARSLSTV